LGFRSSNIWADLRKCAVNRTRAFHRSPKMGVHDLLVHRLEQIIERAMLQFDGRIALDDLRSMMEGSGFDDPGASTDTQTVH